MKKTTVNKIFFFLILFFGFLVRFVNFGEIPDSIYWDEVAILADAKVMAQTGQDMHNLDFFSLIRPSYGDFKLNIYVFLTSIVVKFLGVSSFSVRFVSFLAGIGNLILVYFFSKKLFFKNKNKELIGLIAMFILAISPWSILFSRTGFESHLACFFFNLSLYFLIDLKKIKAKNIYFSIFFAILATYTYYSVRFIWPFIFLLYFIVRIFYFKKKNIKTFFIYFFKYFALPFLIYFTSLFLFSKNVFYQDFQNLRLSTSSILNSIDRDEIILLRNWSGDNFFSKLFFNHKTFFVAKLMINYSKHLNFDFIFFQGDSNLRHSTGEHGLFLFPLILPFFLGLIFLAKNNIKIFIFLLFWWIFALLPASVPNNVPHALRSLNAIFPITFFIAYGFFIIFLWMKQKKSKIINLTKLLILIFYFAFISFTFFDFLFFYFGNYRKNSADSWQYDYQHLVEKIDEQKDGVNKVNIVDFDDRFYLWYLAFGKISSYEIQNLESANYRFKKIKNIDFHFQDWPDLNNKFASLVICLNNSCEEKIKENELQPRKIEKLILDKKISDNFFTLYFF